MLPEAGQPAGGCRFGVSQIIVVVEDGEQRRQEERSARRCMLLIDSNEAARPAGGAPERDAEAKGYDVFHAKGTQRGVLRSGEPLLRVAAANRVRVRDGRAQIADGPAVALLHLGGRRLRRVPEWRLFPWGGPAKGLKAAIVDVIWGVQASKWRTPRVLIVRCNSALDVPSAGHMPERLGGQRGRVRYPSRRTLAWRLASRIAGPSTNGGRFLCWPVGTISVVLEPVVSRENSDFGRHGESYIVRTPTWGAGASEPARLSKSSTSSSPCSASAPSGDEPNRSRPGGAGRRPRGGGGAPPRKRRTRCSRCRPGLAPRRRPGRAAGHGAGSAAACWGTGGARSGS